MGEGPAGPEQGAGRRVESTFSGRSPRSGRSPGKADDRLGVCASAQTRVPEEGVENALAYRVDVWSQGYEGETPPKVADRPVSTPETAPSGPASGPLPDHVDVALARALDLAVSRGDLELVARLVEELRARRLAAAVNVVDLETARKAGR